MLLTLSTAASLIELYLVHSKIRCVIINSFRSFQPSWVQIFSSAAHSPLHTHTKGHIK
jgi:hypothetical protein